MPKPNTHVINFIPNPLQKQFIESKAKADLFSSRMGEGKSAGLAWAVLYHTRHNPGATWYLIRDTWENLQATTQKEFFKWFPPGIMGTYHATKKEFTWASGIAQGTVGFLGMDDPGDATKLMSRDMAGFGMDEPAPAVGSAGIDEMIFDIALSRLRQPGMNWYAGKLAENNPDEAHWTYRRFVIPGTPSSEVNPGGFRVWQPSVAENTTNLPSTYYQGLRELWAHRPDLIRRFVDGEFGFQSIGKAVTPQWNDKLHLGLGLIPVPRQPLLLGWDWGHNPTCLITQKTPLGTWNILHALVGDGIGSVELIEDAVGPLLRDRFKGFSWKHTGDPSGETGDQSDRRRSPVSLMKKVLGGTWVPGPVKPIHRIPPLQWALTQTIKGRGLVQVDKHEAAAVWHALRGGWHHHVARTGMVSAVPYKDIHSHPGDAASYLAAWLFHIGKAAASRSGFANPKEASYFGSGERSTPRYGGPDMPQHGDPMPTLPRSR